MVGISVVTLPPLNDNIWKYNVEITENDGNGSKTIHQVTMDKDYYIDLRENGKIIRMAMKQFADAYANSVR